MLDISGGTGGLKTILFVAEEIVDVINKFLVGDNLNKFADDTKDAVGA